MPINNNVSSNSSNNSNNSNTSNNNNIYTGEFDKYKYEEFAVQGKLTLIDIPNTQSTGNITGISTINWSGKKKPITGQIHLNDWDESNELFPLWNHPLFYILPPRSYYTFLITYSQVSSLTFIWHFFKISNPAFTDNLSTYALS